jgi:hypothetical protein
MDGYDGCMAHVRVRDTSLWATHIEDDPELRKSLESLSAGERVWLRVNGKRGCFEKMKAGPNGPMPGLKPVDETRDLWRQIYPSRAGQLVELSRDDAPPSQGSVSASSGAVVPEPADHRPGATAAERDAAWAAFKALTQAGWRSEGGASVGRGRDELHER